MTASALGDPTDVFAVLRHEDARWMGRLLAPRGDGPPRLSFAADRAPVRLPLGTTMTAGLAGPKMERPAQCRATLTGVEWRDEQVAVEIELDDPTIWSQVMPGGYRRASDRRQWPRLTPPMPGEVLVAVQLQAGPRSARLVPGYLLDASRGGVGVRLPMQAERRLALGTQFRVLLQAPDGPELRQCTVRHRKLLPGAVRYGFQFDSPPLERTQTFEPVWTCTGCGAAPLLGNSQAHCPACGTARVAHTTFPDWDDLVTTETHRFTGVQRTCLRCGSGWSDESRNCGHCGTRLPHGGIA